MAGKKWSVTSNLLEENIYISVCALGLAKNKINLTQENSKWFFEVLLQEQDFLHYVLNDGDNIYGIWGGCVHHIAPSPGFWFLTPDHTVCQESRWKLGPWLRREPTVLSWVPKGTDRLIHTHTAQKLLLYTGRFFWCGKIMWLVKVRWKEVLIWIGVSVWGYAWVLFYGI